ncbi:outer membrane receptor proteins [alpha proteobacterium U9-1i]|nr:outer membrane receptor proteins [alpha proteobacterium U9-1i]
MTRTLRTNFGVFAACATAAISVHYPAYAQPSGSDEIVVTATRRNTALQEVPVAVTPVTAEMVRNSGIRDLHDLTNVAPSLQFNISENETSATARIRGIGTQGSNPGLESAVGVFVDGVYRARNGVALTDLGEISQIEVLRGPQGTLFGRNTSAGLITVATAAPALDDFGAAAEALVGAFGERRLAGHITGPIVQDELGVRLFASVSQRDGFVDVIGPTGATSDANNRDLWSLRGQVLWAPTGGRFDWRLIADYTERDELCCAGVFYDPAVVNGASGEGYAASAPAVALASIGGFGPGGIAALGPSGLSDRTSFANRDATQELRDGGVSSEMNWETSLGLLTWIAGYRDWDFIQGQDIDFTAADLLYRAPGDGGFGFQIHSQEVRLTGRNGPLDWLVGGYYANEHLTRRDTLRIGTQYGEYFTALGVATGNLTVIGAAPVLATTEGGGQRDRYRQESQSIALFSHNILALGDRTDFTFGIRFTDEEKDMSALRGTVGALPAPLSAFPWHNGALDGVSSFSRSEAEWSGLVALRQEMSENLAAYLSFSRGYKGGGFNLDRQAGVPEFDAETVESWELGAKTTWMDGDLLLNAALFSSDYENFQLNRFTGITFIVNSIPAVSSEGAEVDVIWRMPLTGLSMQGGLAYADAQYGSNTGWAVGGLAALPGQRLTNSPLWTITNALTYEWPLGSSLAGLAHLDFRYVDEQNTGSDLSPSKVQPSYVLINGRLGIATADERYAFEIWGRNLLDEDYAQVMFDAPLQFLRPVVPVDGLRGAFLGDPRTYGVTLRARY